MYFGYTFCPDVCPTDMQAIAAGLKLLDKSAPAKAKKIVPLFITVDPERDTAPSSAASPPPSTRASSG